jgi:hypothetical protein
VGSVNRPSRGSCHRIDGTNRTGSWVEKVIGYQMMSVMMSDEDESVEIIQDEEPREEESGAPERIRNP